MKGPGPARSVSRPAVVTSLASVLRSGVAARIWTTLPVAAGVAVAGAAGRRRARGRRASGESQLSGAVQDELAWHLVKVIREDARLRSEMEAEVREMADWLVALGEAPVLDDYLGPVLFEEPAAVELFRQLAAPEMVGSPPPSEGRGIFGEVSDKRPQARVGRRLLPNGWSIVDDPGEGGVGGYELDYEGTPGQRVTVVEDGVVRKLLQSRIPGTAPASTGHGRSLGTDRREAMPSMVQVTPKRSRSDRALRRRALRLAEQTGHDSVLVIRRIEPPAMTEDFEIFFTGDGPAPGLTRPYEAYLLHKDGSTTPVRGLRFSGVDRRVMRDIVIAGEPGPYHGVLDDQPGPARFYVGAVGGIPCSWSAPPVVITELELVGGKGGELRVIPAPPRD